MGAEAENGVAVDEAVDLLILRNGADVDEGVGLHHQVGP